MRGEAESGLINVGGVGSDRIQRGSRVNVIRRCRLIDVRWNPIRFRRPLAEVDHLAPLGAERPVRIPDVPGQRGITLWAMNNSSRHAG